MWVWSLALRRRHGKARRASSGEGWRSRGQRAPASRLASASLNPLGTNDERPPPRGPNLLMDSWCTRVVRFRAGVVTQESQSSFRLKTASGRRKLQPQNQHNILTRETDAVVERTVCAIHLPQRHCCLAFQVTSYYCRSAFALWQTNAYMPHDKLVLLVCSVPSELRNVILEKHEALQTLTTPQRGGWPGLLGP